MKKHFQKKKANDAIKKAKNQVNTNDKNQAIRNTTEKIKLDNVLNYQRSIIICK